MVTSAVSSTRPDPITIDLGSNQQSTVDGVPADDSVIDEILAQNGLRRVNGQFETIDGVQVTASTAGVVSFGGAQPLPGTLGGTMDAASVTQKLEWMSDFTEGSLMWMAFSTLAETAMRDVKDAKDLRNAFQLMKLNAKKNAIKATESQIEAERDAANEALMWAVVAAVVQFIVTALLVGNEATQAYAGMGPALGGVAQAAGTAHAKNEGARRKADDKRVEKMRHDFIEAVHDQAIEESRSNYEEAKELFKLALKVMTEHMERESQVVQKITS